MSILQLPFPAGYGKSAKERRSSPGRTYLGQWVHLLPRVNQRVNWLRGSERQLSRIPFHIACSLDNIDFKSFDDFRVAIWKLIAADAFVNNIYSDDTRRQEAIRKGIAPKADESQRVTQAQPISNGSIKHHVTGSSPETSGVILESERRHGDRDSYQIHHHQPIHTGGGVYEISNLIIITPKAHQQLLSPEHHYGRTGMPEWKQEYIQKKIQGS